MKILFFHRNSKYTQQFFILHVHNHWESQNPMPCKWNHNFIIVHYPISKLILITLRFFGLLSSSLLLFSQRFGWCVLWPSSGVCRTREPPRNFELRPLLKPRGSPVLIPLRFNPHCRWVTIQEYLTLVPSYG